MNTRFTTANCAINEAKRSTAEIQFTAKLKSTAVSRAKDTDTVHRLKTVMCPPAATEMGRIIDRVRSSAMADICQLLVNYAWVR